MPPPIPPIHCRTERPPSPPCITLHHASWPRPLPIPSSTEPSVSPHNDTSCPLSDGCDVSCQQLEASDRGLQIQFHACTQQEAYQDLQLQEQIYQLKGYLVLQLVRKAMPLLPSAKLFSQDTAPLTRLLHSILTEPYLNEVALAFLGPDPEHKYRCVLLVFCLALPWLCFASHLGCGGSPNLLVPPSAGVPVT